MYICVGAVVTLDYPVQEHQLKTKLNKQLREKEDYILQVLAQKRKLEEQLNVKEKEKVSLQQVSLSSLIVAVICNSSYCQ